LGQKQTSAKSDVRLAPNSDRKRGFPQVVMSALPPKADMCSATRDVRFGPIADSCSATKWIAIRSPRRRVDHRNEMKEAAG
jgi:hypothetical protein